MSSKNRNSYVLIGLAFLLICLLLAKKILSGTIFSVLWPVLLIVIGIALFIYLQRNPNAYKSLIPSTENFDIKIGEWEPENPFLKVLIGIPLVIFILTMIGLVMFGILTPVLAVVGIVVGIVLLFALGIAFVSVLIPFAIIAAPIILIIWLITLLF